MARETSEGIVCGSMCSQGQLRTPTTCLHYAHPIVVPAKVIIGKVTPDNQVPLVTLPMGAKTGQGAAV